MGENNYDWQTSCCNEPQKAFLYLYLVYWIIVVLLAETLLAKPMRLLTTAVHEISHAIVCWLTCGHVVKVAVYENEGGVTHYRGGCRCCIAPAGYLGEAVVGMLFCICSGGRKTATFAAASLIVALLACLCYRPNRVLVILNVCYACLFLILIFLEWYVFTPLLAFCTLLFAVFFSHCAISDIFHHLILRSTPGNDAYALYEESGRMCCCPPRCIGFTWCITAIILQFLGIWMTLILMSDECENAGWWECIFHSRFDLDWNPDYNEWWPDDWNLFDNGP